MPKTNVDQKAPTAGDLGIDLAIRMTRGWEPSFRALKSEYGMTRATAYRWAKRLREAKARVARVPTVDSTVTA